MFQFHSIRKNVKFLYNNWRLSVEKFNDDEFLKRLEFARQDKIKKFINDYPQYEGLQDQLEAYYLIDDVKRKDLTSKESSKIVWSYMWGTTADDYSQLSNLYEDIQPSMFDLYTLQEEKKEIERITPKVIKTKPIVRRLKEININNDLIYNLGFRTFEELIQELLIYQGFEVELTPSTHDKGHDLITRKTVSGMPIKFLVECKRYAPHRAVGIGKVREFCDVIAREKANKGIMITTSYYSRESIKRQKEKGYLLELLDGKDIEGWIRDYINNRPNSR